jgi:hypothetical protein
MMAALALAPLCGCASTEAVQLGERKYSLPGTETGIAANAQAFCHGKGFDHAETGYTSNNFDFTGDHTSFWCLNAGENLTHPADVSVEVHNND